jgi:glycine cleavage system H lipoate-binding protein
MNGDRIPGKIKVRNDQLKEIKDIYAPVKGQIAERLQEFKEVWR